MTRLIFPGFFLLFLNLSAQTSYEFGQLTPEEQAFTTYDRDTTARAVYLFEQGENYFEIENDRIWLYKEYRARIKILSEEGYDYASVTIPYYRGEKSSEKITEVHAMTHNGTTRVGVAQNEIFDNDQDAHWSELRFTFPEVRVGSVLEYTYKLRSPFFYNFKGWSFQSAIPKLYTEFNARIPGNYQYNRDLIGSLELFINSAHIERACLEHGAFRKAPDCEVLRYAMRDVPAFREEPFMLAPSNFRSRLEFELSKSQSFSGGVSRYTQSWEDVDTKFRKDADLGRQLTKKNFFEKQVPETLLTGGTDLERAHRIYNFVRDHYTWNGDTRIYSDSRVKDAFASRSGNISEINMTLINLLNAADLQAQLVLSATRAAGLPKLTRPVMTDFNYVIARVELDGKRYFLDASDKFIPFGMLPQRALNYYGRVMDRREESTWEDFNMNERSMVNVRTQLVFGDNPSHATGVLYAVRKGYEGVNALRELAELGEAGYMEAIENSARGDLKLSGHTIDPDKTDERTVTERLDFSIENAVNDELIYLDPFIIRFFSENPFKSADRQYPVDLAYARDYIYNLSIALPEGYQIESLPDDATLSLPNGVGKVTFRIEQNGKFLLLNFAMRLGQSHYPVDLYPALRELFETSVQVQNQSMVVLKKAS